MSCQMLGGTCVCGTDCACVGCFEHDHSTALANNRHSVPVDDATMEKMKLLFEEGDSANANVGSSSSPYSGDADPAAPVASPAGPAAPLTRLSTSFANLNTLGRRNSDPALATTAGCCAVNSNTIDPSFLVMGSADSDIFMGASSTGNYGYDDEFGF